MNLFPAIDLYDGCAVRLIKGDYNQMQVYSNDPVSVAKQFEAAGAEYLHVVDLAKAHVVAITRMVEGKNKQPYEVFNVGTGNGVSVLELLRGFERVNGVKVNHKIAPRRAGDVVAIWADTKLANEELGWKAERSLDDTLRSAWAWEKNVRGIE